METYISKMLFPVIFCLSGYTFGEVCDPLSEISIQYLGMRMKDNVKLVVNTTTNSECARQCKLFGFCKSINYGIEAQQCELNEKDSVDSPGDIEENKDYDYFDIDDWPEEIAEGCAGHSCLTDELCIPGPNKSSVCLKAAEFMDQKLDECADNPCKNGGTCRDFVNRYTCDCAPGWRGERCDIDVNECKSRPCHNGGTCIDGVNDFSCNCPLPYTGKQCLSTV